MGGAAAGGALAVKSATTYAAAVIIGPMLCLYKSELRRDGNEERTTDGAVLDAAIKCAITVQYRFDKRVIAASNRTSGSNRWVGGKLHLALRKSGKATRRRQLFVPQLGVWDQQNDGVECSAGSQRKNTGTLRALA